MIYPGFTIFKWLILGLAMNKDQWDPEFLKAIPIMKTRSGMQVKTSFSVNIEWTLF